MRPIPIVDASDQKLANMDRVSAAAPVSRQGLFDPQRNRATMFATLAVTFLWFAVALALMWLAASFGTGSVSNTYLLLALAFAIVSVGLFAAAVGAGGPPRNPATGGLVFVATLFSVFAVAWFGALVEVRWLVVPMSYGVGIALTRHFRQVPVSVSAALRS